MDLLHEGENEVQKLPLFVVSDLTTVYRVNGEINQSAVTFIIDTGAPVTLLRTDTWERVKAKGTELEGWNGPLFGWS